MNSQFAVRVAVLSGIALIAFAAIFFRLWYLQVLSGKEYLKQAEDNRVRTVTIQAPRGEILDRHGKVLVDNRTALSLQVRADQLPKARETRNAELRRLSRISQISLPKIKREIRQQTNQLPANPVTLARDVAAQSRLLSARAQRRVPGGHRRAGLGSRLSRTAISAAHLFGFVAEIGPKQLKEPQYKKLAPGDQIGAAGLEQEYDQVLRGRNGEIRIPVDASGHPKGKQISEVQPQVGDNLVLTLDKKIQQAGENAIKSWGGGKPGAFVVMNARDGSILGMGSYPEFDPSVYTPPVSLDKIKALNDAPDNPLLDRAIQSAYPTGSTFKPITATAALDAGVITPDTIFSDTGYVQIRRP